MTDINILAPWIFSWEGGFVNHPKDPGGATNKGITIATWKAQGYDKDGDGDIDVDDLKLITEADATAVMKRAYWDRWHADDILSQSIANLLVDWVWASGAWGIRIPQQILGVKPDSIVGPKTISALNSRILTYGAEYVFNELKDRRYNFIRSCKGFDTFGKGWLRRLGSICFESLIRNSNPPTSIEFHDYLPR